MGPPRNPQQFRESLRVGISKAECTCPRAGLGIRKAYVPAKRELTIVFELIGQHLVTFRSGQRFDNLMHLLYSIGHIHFHFSCQKRSTIFLPPAQSLQGSGAASGTLARLGRTPLQLDSLAQVRGWGKGCCLEALDEEQSSLFFLVWTALHISQGAQGGAGPFRCAPLSEGIPKPASGPGNLWEEMPAVVPWTRVGAE